MPHPTRGFLDARRWHTVDCFPDRKPALDHARRLRRANAFGEGHAFRVAKMDTGSYCVQHAGPLSKRDREHGAHYNRRMIRERPMGL